MASMLDNESNEQVNIVVDLVENKTNLPIRSSYQRYTSQPEAIPMGRSEVGTSGYQPVIQDQHQADYAFRRWSEGEYRPGEYAEWRAASGYGSDWDIATDEDIAAQKQYLAEKGKKPDFEMPDIKIPEQEKLRAPGIGSVRIQGDYTPGIQQMTINDLSTPSAVQSAILGKRKALLGLEGSKDQSLKL